MWTETEHPLKCQQETFHDWNFLHFVLCFQVAQNGSLSEFFESFGGQLEDANFANSFSAEVAVPSPIMSTAVAGQMAAVQQLQPVNAVDAGYRSIPAANQSNRVVAVNVPFAQSSGSTAVSQQMVYYNGLE